MNAGLDYVVAVVVTHERPVLLRRCLKAIRAQRRPPDRVIVVDNASGAETRRVVEAFGRIDHLRLARNLGGASGYRAGIEAALQCGAHFVWTMDDDGVAADPDCLGRLVESTTALRADIAGPLVLDIEHPDRLAFPLRHRGQALRRVGDVPATPLAGFAHLFNGSLIRADLFRKVGLPNPTLVMRGDEVEFLARSRQAGARVMLIPAARFRHPSSRAELRPMLRGRFHAVLPHDPLKRRYTFRNRGYIFARYGLWLHLAADVARYAWFFLVTRRGDLSGLANWWALTRAGVRLRHAVDLPAA